MTTASAEEILVPVVALCGIVCVAGFLLTFALSRRLHDSAARPSIGLGELVKPLAGGMVLGLLILASRLGDPSSHFLTRAAPDMSVLLSALLSVALAGACAGAL